MANARGLETEDDCTPKYSSSSLGVGERMNRVVEGQIRTMRNALEAVLHMPVTIDFAVMTWMVRLAAWVLTRFQVCSDGFTAYEEVKQRDNNGDVAAFCDMVMLKEAGKHMVKLADRWVGLVQWLGNSDRGTSIWWLFTKARRWPRDDLSAGCR